MLNFLEELDRVHDAPEDDRAEILNDVLRRASIAFGGSDSASLHLVRGYAAYHHPELIEGMFDVESELNAVLSIRSDDITARFYLACHYFDMNSFQKAHEHVSLLNTSQYREAGQEWRVIKIDELKLCCEAALENYCSFASGLSRLVDVIVSTEADNVPSPSELVQCFEARGQRLYEELGIEAYRECLSLLQAYVVHSGMSDVFEDRVTRLRTASGDTRA
ncbi:MAG: hypothetical protein KF777_17610 [Planctomycetaceae bacterium]|nr:hypothetical protein [Planctomycetaceae bacterium]